MTKIVQREFSTKYIENKIKEIENVDRFRHTGFGK